MADDHKVYSYCADIYKGRNKRGRHDCGIEPNAWRQASEGYSLRLLQSERYKIIVPPMDNAMSASPCPITMILIPFTTASITLTTAATRTSLNITLNKSRNSISPTDNPRITSVELCEPQFPPVPVSIGIKPASCGITTSALS